MKKGTSDGLVNLMVKIMQIEGVEEVPVDLDNEDEKKIMKKSMTGRLPLLEAGDGVFISESLPIARFLTKDHSSFQGANDSQSKLNCRIGI